MSLPPPPTVEKLQTALHTKAKGSPDYRFYVLAAIIRPGGRASDPRSRRARSSWPDVAEACSRQAID